MPLAGRTVLVAGAGVSGRPTALALASRGARVTVVDERTTIDDSELEPLRAADIDVVVGPEPALPPGTDLVVTSPGWHPDHPLLTTAAAAGVEVIGDVELAWRLRPVDAAPWLGVTGTNGKTTTTRMTAAILTAAGHRALAAGNVGTPAIDAVVADPPLDVVVVELSSFQLHWSSTITCAAAAILNLAEDHLDWHGDFAHYVADKLTIWAGGLMVANRDDPEVAKRLVGRSGRVVAVTSGPPQPGEIGVVDGQLLDRAFAAGEVLAAVDDIRPAGPHQVTNALVAAALARSHGVAAAAVHAGLTGYRPDRHRGDVIAEIGRVRYVDDSKATNPHAALASLSAYPRVVWIAGGLLKGADLGPTVQAAADRLVAAVVIGRDRRPVLDALARHAPGVTVVEVHSADTGAMDEAVRAAARLASAGDTVLLAPAAASMDLFRDYAHRGDAFAAAVQRLRSS